MLTENKNQQVGLNYDDNLPPELVISAFLSITWGKCEPAKPELDNRDVENLKNGHPLGM